MSDAHPTSINYHRSIRSVFRTLLIALALFSVVYFGVYLLLIGGFFRPRISFEWENTYKPISEVYQQIVIHASGYSVRGEPQLIEECRLTVSLIDNDGKVHSLESIYRPYDAEHQNVELLGSYLDQQAVEKWLVNIGVDGSLQSFGSEARELRSVLGSAVAGYGTPSKNVRMFTVELSE